MKLLGQNYAQSLSGNAGIWRSRKRWSYVKKLRLRRVRISATLSREVILTLKVGLAYMQKDLKKEEQQSPLYGSHSAFLSFIHSHFSAEAMHDRVFFSLSRARIVNFIMRKKFPTSIPDRRCLLFVKSILTTPAYSSGNRIRSTIGSSRSLYFW